MPRITRVVVPGVAHHVVQRSHLGHGFFFTDADRRRYLELLAKYAAQHRLQVFAWCLLPDQVQLVVVPKGHDSLGGMMKSLNTRYSMHLRKTRKEWGLLYGRFFSCPLDKTHTWEAVRHVERSPLRARLIARPERYKWSSAGGHAGLRKDPLLSGALESRGKVKDWVKWLRADEDAALVESIDLCTRTGRPAGDEAFIARIEKLTGLRFVKRKRGRPPGRKAKGERGRKRKRR